MVVHILIPSNAYKTIAIENATWLKEDFTPFLQKYFDKGVMLGSVKG